MSKAERAEPLSAYDQGVHRAALGCVFRPWRVGRQTPRDASPFDWLALLALGAHSGGRRILWANALSLAPLVLLLPTSAFLFASMVVVARNLKTIYLAPIALLAGSTPFLLVLLITLPSAVVIKVVAYLRFLGPHRKRATAIAQVVPTLVLAVLVALARS